MVEHDQIGAIKKQLCNLAEALDDVEGLGGDPQRVTNAIWLLGDLKPTREEFHEVARQWFKK